MLFHESENPGKKLKFKQPKIFSGQCAFFSDIPDCCFVETDLFEFHDLALALK